MKISVIVGTYNRCESLKDTLDSLLNQECEETFDYEVIVADNNSQDNTKEVTESYKKKFNGKLKYLFERRQGKQYALNTGLKRAKGEIIALTDDDCIVDKKWILEIIKTFKLYNVGIVGGIINPVWLSKKPRWLNEKFYSMLALQNYGSIPFVTSSIKRIPFGANCAFKKYLFNTYGMFHKELKNSQDTEICTRFLEKGVKIGYNPKIIVNHKVDSSRLNKTYFINWFYRRELLYKHTNNGKKKFQNLVGIPLWMFSDIIRDLRRSFSTVLPEPERVYYRCRSFGYLGMIIARFKK